jgi:membrane-bound metal-dependent hydrolase YbcI (DUF457 family)
MRERMFIGHFAVGFAAKRLTPRISLGVLLAAPLLLDLLWPVFLAVGIESVRIEPGNTVVTPLDLHDYPYSHSLLMASVWAIGAGVAASLWQKSRLAGITVGALVWSHWLLDFVTHRPDMPLYPGSRTYLGLGLWNSLWGTLVVELLMFGSGVALYAMGTRAQNKRGGLGLWCFIASLLALYFAAIFGPPPPNESALISGGLGVLLLVAWGFWADRHRVARGAATSSLLGSR